MKHPNKKVENLNRARVKNKVKSCFYYWIDEYNHIEKIDLTEDDLLNAIANIRKNGKTVSVDLNQL